jgi:hypothetical protein
MYILVHSMSKVRCSTERLVYILRHGTTVVLTVVWYGGRWQATACNNNRDPNVTLSYDWLVREKRLSRLHLHRTQSLIDKIQERGELAL